MPKVSTVGRVRAGGVSERFRRDEETRDDEMINGFYYLGRGFTLSVIEPHHHRIQWRLKKGGGGAQNGEAAGRLTNYYEFAIDYF